MITFVWAEDENGIIGNEGGIPWDLPSDMSFFKETTMHGAVVMGRKTLESIPNPPLKHRKNIILTRNKNYKAVDGVKVFHTKEEVLNYIKDLTVDIHIIGGPAIFDMFKDEVDVLHRTIIHEEFPGDTAMIPLDMTEWQLVSRVPGQVDGKNKYAHDFETYTRVNKK